MLTHKIKRFVINIRRMLYNRSVTKAAEKVGKNLKVNGKSRVTPKTKLGDNVNFNGMKIIGRGQVIIGNNFHSGQNAL
jgi:hypothetical protein